MPVIGMIGPHACGKSTAVKRWQSKYGDKIECYSLDNMQNDCGDNSAKIKFIDQCRLGSKVCVVESGKGFAGWVASLTPDDPFIVLTCPEPVGRQWMIERRKGKPLSEYWTPKMLDYEYNRRIINWHRKCPWSKHFVITDRVTDWPKVDAYLFSVFAKLHNRRVVVS